MPTYHDQHGGQIKIFCEAPRIAATFSNWHS